MKECFLTQRGPKAIGPYCTAVTAGDLTFLSGMIPADPETGALVGDDAAAQARRALDNIGIVLGEMGLSFASVVKTTVFMTDLSAFAAVNAVYAEYMGPDFPARSCVQVSALPKGALVEIEVVCAK